MSVPLATCGGGGGGGGVRGDDVGQSRRGRIHARPTCTSAVSPASSETSAGATLSLPGAEVRSETTTGEESVLVTWSTSLYTRAQTTSRNSSSAGSRLRTGITTESTIVPAARLGPLGYVAPLRGKARRARRARRCLGALNQHATATRKWQLRNGRSPNVHNQHRRRIRRTGPEGPNAPLLLNRGLAV